MRRILAVVLTLVVCLPTAVWSIDPEDEAALGQHLATLLRAGRDVVSEHQYLINDPEIADKGLDGDSVVEQAIAKFTELTGKPPITPEMPERERRITEALIESMREVVDEHEAEIDTPGMGFKGFIPAVYGRLVGERFGEKVGTEARIKATAPEELVRNRKARPDDWEREVIESRLILQDWPKGEPFTERTEVAGRPAFRMLIPEYYAESCLSCHGQPKGEMDITGYPKEGGAEGDLAGAISITFFE